MMNVFGKIRFAAVGAIIVGMTGSSVTAAPLIPATISMASAGITDVTPVRWRGHGSGGAGLAAGLATGLIIGGLLAAPRYYDEPYPYYDDGYYARDMSDRSVTAHRVGRLIAFHAIVRSIPSAEHIWVTMVDDYCQ